MTNAQAEAAASGKLSWFTRISYGLGDTAQNVVWGAMSILTFFYTDYAGIDPATVGLVMLLSRLFDGVSDVIMGFIVEKRIQNGVNPVLGFYGQAYLLQYPLY